MERDDAIVVTGLRKSFDTLEVLKGVDLRVARGSILALLGPNGAGKTTIVKILSTLLRPDSGRVTVDGYDVVREADRVRHVIGLTGQYATVDEYLSGRENLEMMGKLYHLGRERSALRAQELLERFDLIEAASRSAKSYSGGMRRRLDLAVSLIAAPPILFLDEPTTGLDPRSRLTMWSVIGELKKQGTTILLTTQYLEEADKLANRIVVIDHGHVLAEGSSEELKARVGREQLEITLRSEDFAKAKTLGDVQDAHFDEETGVMTITTDGSVGSVKRTLDLLEQSNIAIESLALHKPTLDDVFLHLTGHKTESTQQDNAPEAPKA